MTRRLRARVRRLLQLWGFAPPAYLFSAAPVWVLLLDLLCATRPYYGDRHETAAQRRTLLEPTAADLASVTEDLTWLAAAAATGRWESHYARYVLEGRCSDGPMGARECDGGAARGAWQHHHVSCPEAYRFEDGSRESRLAEARCTIARLRGALHACRGKHPAGDWAGMMAGFRSQLDCDWPQGKLRADTMWVYYSRLKRAQNESGASGDNSALTPGQPLLAVGADGVQTIHLLGRFY